MKAKIIKGFFEVEREGRGGTYMVRVVPDEFAVANPGHPETPDLTCNTHVASCPLYSGTWGYVYSAGYVLTSRLRPLRNIKVNRDRIRMWAAARRAGIEKSERMYQMMKGAAE